MLKGRKKSLLSFMHVHRNIHLAFFDQSQARIMAEHELKSNFLIFPLHYAGSDCSNENNGFCPCSLVQIYKFDHMVREVSRKNIGTKLVFCAKVDKSAQMKVVFLIGAHLIMTHSVEPEGVKQAFRSIVEQADSLPYFSEDSKSVLSCWNSLAFAKGLDWLNFWGVFDTSYEQTSINLDEYMHYASHINGEITTVVPGKIFLFAAPTGDLPVGALWADAVATTPACGRHRRFSAAFYAALLRDLGASLVMRLDWSDYDASPFEQAGMAVCSLGDLGCLRDHDKFSLQVLDRFVSALDGATGAAAVHCDGPAAAGHAYTLLTAYLLRRRGFPSAAHAVAWIHMAAAGAAPDAQVEVSLFPVLSGGALDGPAAEGATGVRRRSRRTSMCTEADLAPLTRAAAEGRAEVGGVPFPRGPGSPRRGSSFCFFSSSSPNVFSQPSSPEPLDFGELDAGVVRSGVVEAAAARLAAMQAAVHGAGFCEGRLCSPLVGDGEPPPAVPALEAWSLSSSFKDLGCHDENAL